MYSSNLENELIIIDIEDVLQDFVSIQFDIDSTKLKAAQKLAIDLELTKFMSRENIDRCIDQPDDASEADKNLLKLVVPALCHFTYEKCLTYFQGALYDAGWSTENQVSSRAEAKNQSVLANSFGNQYMQSVVKFLEEENPNADTTIVESRPSTQAIGGEEYWGKNYSNRRFGKGFG